MLGLENRGKDEKNLRDTQIDLSHSLVALFGVLTLVFVFLLARDVKGVEKNGNSDPYVSVSVQNKKGKYKSVHKTEPMKNTINPVVRNRL